MHFRLRFRQVRYFVEIVDAGSITQASHRLNLAPTALSLQMRKLEDQFGVTLLERHPKGVSPTARGRVFYDCAQRILSLLEETERTLVGQSGPAMRYRFGLPPGVLHTIGLKALLHDADAADGVAIDVVEGTSPDLVARLEAGDIDFMLGWVEGSPAAIRTVELAEEAIVFVTAREAAHPGDAIPLAEALSGDLIHFGGRSMSWDLVCQRAEAAGLRPERARPIESLGLLRRMLCDGLGTAILPVSFVGPEYRAGAVTLRPVQDERLWRRLAFAWRETVQWDGAECAVISYIETLIAEFLALTAPYSRSLQPLSRVLFPEGETTAG